MRFLLWVHAKGLEIQQTASDEWQQARLSSFRMFQSIGVCHQCRLRLFLVHLTSSNG